jgi:hypothetical protein
MAAIKAPISSAVRGPAVVVMRAEIGDITRMQAQRHLMKMLSEVDEETGIEG